MHQLLHISPSVDQVELISVQTELTMETAKWWSPSQRGHLSPPMPVSPSWMMAQGEKEQKSSEHLLKSPQDTLTFREGLPVRQSLALLKMIQVRTHTDHIEPFHMDQKCGSNLCRIWTGHSLHLSHRPWHGWVDPGYKSGSIPGLRLNLH